MRLSRSHISGSGLVELTQVDSVFLFSMFFHEIDFFFHFHPVALNYCPLNFVIQPFAILWGYCRCRLVKLTRVDLSFFQCFFIDITLVFFSFFFLNYFFHLDLIFWVTCLLSYPRLTRVIIVCTSFLYQKKFYSTHNVVRATYLVMTMMNVDLIVMKP